MGSRGKRDILTAHQRVQALGYADMRAAVAALADTGLSSLQIAARLGVSQRAVKHNRKKLGLFTTVRRERDTCLLLCKCQRRVRLGRPASCEKRLPWECGRMTSWVRRWQAVRDV